MGITLALGETTDEARHRAKTAAAAITVSSTSHN
jgi:formate-dependent phosphoribosylglycinamide formyltransferase (GAR transformylase)